MQDGHQVVVAVFHAVSLFDEVTVTPAERDSVVVTGEGDGTVPLDGSNLAIQAVTALVDTLGPGCGDAPGVSIEIKKRIPVAAGLAGGSADAAAALAACDGRGGAGLSQHELSEVASRVGSDFAFAMLGGTAIGLGRGDQVTPALVTGTYHWVLAFAAVELSTAAVYAACDRLRASRGGRPGQPGEARHPAPVGPVGPPQLDTALMTALRSGDPAELGPLLTNDLQPAALSLLPDLRRGLTAGREHGALGAVVSGSGPTCAFLAPGAGARRG